MGEWFLVFKDEPGYEGVAGPYESKAAAEREIPFINAGDTRRQPRAVHVPVDAIARRTYRALLAGEGK